MPGFDTTTVTSVDPPTYWGGDLVLSWTGTLPAGKIWQVYVDNQLADHTVTNRSNIPWPRQPAWFDIGSVDRADALTSFADSLPAKPRTHTTLSWEGGTFLDPMGGDVKGFRVYGERTPGGGIDYTTPLADIPAYTARIVTDGFGLGGFGSGGFGMVAGSYSWRSGVLTSGTWSWAVAAYNSAGINGAIDTTSDVITAPPEPPALQPDGVTRLLYTVVGFGSIGFGEGEFGAGGTGQAQIQLSWLPSPSA
jgi:hypothetical protein